MKDFWGTVGWILHPCLSQGESCGGDVEEGDTTKWSMMVTPRDTRVPQSLSGHAGASATLGWSVQLNLLSGTWKGQAFPAATDLDL